MQFLGEDVKGKKKWYCYGDDQLWLGDEQRWVGHIAPEAEEATLEGRATYWGGHFLHPAGRTGDIGRFTITKDNITFRKFSLLGGYELLFEIPLDRIIWKNITQTTGEDLQYRNQLALGSYFTTGLPMASGMLNTTYVTIPFKDYKGIDHAPKFTFPNRKFLGQVSQFIYERMSTSQSPPVVV